MAKFYISRRLKIDEAFYSEAQMLQRGTVFVVLAEPGAGKSDLLEEFGRIWGVGPVKASQFRYRSKLQTGIPIIVDALDEAAKVDQSAFDEIIVKAHEASNGNVIFASRSYAWSEARTRALRDCFQVEPIIIRIEPFTSGEQSQLFADRHPTENFDHFTSEVGRFELRPLLGNPQFLIIFAAAYTQGGRVFRSKAQIFKDAVDYLAWEESESRPPTSEIVAVGAEVMAKVLLAGASGVSTKEVLTERDYPYLWAISSANVAKAHLALDTKLFKPGSSPGSHEPVHYIIAEYCAAKYLVSRLVDLRRPLSLRRLLAIIAPSGAVRDELRGLLGWMACTGDDRIARSAIHLDPYAVLANGDPSQLSTASKRLLLDRLAVVARTNPGFRHYDYSRNFGVGGFFSDGLLDELSRMLRSTPVESPLIDLILELLVNSGGPRALASDVREILLNKSADQHTRMWASRALHRLAGSSSPDDLAMLVKESTLVSMQVAADLVSTGGADRFSDEAIESLLRGYVATHPPLKALRNQTWHLASIHLERVIEQLPPTAIADHLDRITLGMSCTCKRRHYDCECRIGSSKVAGVLLDRYFAAFHGPIHPDRLWSWVRALWYHDRATAQSSAAVRQLAEYHGLRHQLHRRAFEGVSDASQAWEIYRNLSDGHTHSGLTFGPGDEQRMLNFAFDIQNPSLWITFWSGPRSDEASRGPNPIRRLMREQAIAKADFMAVWAQRERDYRSNRENQWRAYGRRNERYRRREKRRVASNRSHLMANREAIARGEMWCWVNFFAEAYFSNRKQLVQYVDDFTIVEDALRNALPLLKDHMPTLDQLARGGGNWEVSRAAFASCWIHYLDRRSLDHIDRATLIVARTQTGKYPTMSDADFSDFLKELDRQIFRTPEDAVSFARGYIEPGLIKSRNEHTNVWWLSNVSSLAHLCPKLSIEWLRAFPRMPVSARRELFDVAARVGDRQALLSIIENEVAVAAKESPQETNEARQERLDDLRFWQVRRFFFEALQRDGWDDLKTDPNVVFEIDSKAGRFGDASPGWPRLSSEMIYKLLDSFIAAWPPVPLPSSYGTGDPPGERAYRFLSDSVWRIGRDAPERALPVIDRLMSDSRFVQFRSALLTIRADSCKKLSLAEYTTPTPEQITTMLDAAGIATVEDLRAFMVEELEALEAQIRTAETNSLVPFYDKDGVHVDENTARDRVVEDLKSKLSAMNMPIEIERYMVGGNRCDIAVSTMLLGQRRLLVVEAKGQWHPDVFTAATSQLSVRYASHVDAAKQGIYLVFWFGPEVRVAGRVNHGITTASGLREKIVHEMPSELRGLIDVVVLDLSR